jgi:competence protein CoiA
MLTAICEVTGEQVWPTPSWRHLKKSGEEKCRGACPFCGEVLVPKRGERVTHHFAHQAKSSCLAAIESEDHRRAKVGIQLGVDVLPGCDAWVEKPIGNSRPDVLLNVRSTTVAVEVQRSSISLEEVRRRTKAYAALGVPVVWVACLSDLTMSREIRSTQEWDGQEYARRDHPYLRVRTTEQERFLHGLYFGRLYAHSGLDYVLPIHLDTEIGWTSTEDVPEGVRAHNPDIPEVGYRRFYKTFRVAAPAPPVSLTSFVARERQAFQTLPAGKLWIDRLDRWWTPAKRSAPGNESESEV